MELSFESRGAARGHRVLVADDYPDTADVLCVLLSILGHECRAVRTGQEALAEARAFQPDIAIVDIGLPDMSGIEVTHQIKQRWPSLAIVALTIHDDEEYFFKMLQAGVNGYVTKRAAPEELLTAVRTAIAGGVYLYPSLAKLLVKS